MKFVGLCPLGNCDIETAHGKSNYSSYISKRRGRGMHFREELTDGFNKIGNFNFFKLSGSLYYFKVYFCIPEIFSNRL